VLSDRITKCQAQKALTVLPQRTEKVLQESLQESEQKLQQLLASPAIQGTTRSVFNAAQKSYNTFIQKNRQINLKDTPALIELAEEADRVGEQVDEVVDQLIKSLNRPVAAVLSHTADMQRLTQHTAVHFLLARLGHKEQEQLKEVREKRTVFDEHLNALKSSPLKTPAISNQLQLLEPQWLLMSTALNRTERDSATLEHISTTSERLLEVLTTLYGSYESILS
jgi:DNA repair ATPase RecN